MDIYTFIIYWTVQNIHLPHNIVQVIPIVIEENLYLVVMFYHKQVQ